ncbi:late embryogenesis abundant protein At5g17165-like [Rutidosis leptorrhynchoides]|uniref:late embryogenesis abundant protein At5g17165-like n=1 Tax=Rutidosis leptorrhynchoides TaxID=125765 RepID=UPI003A99B71B
MAANSQSRSIASLGKRFVNQFRTSSAVDPNLIFRRAVHVSVYDKNIDDQVRPTLVREEAITRAESETDWVPHPKTGVFGPADGQKSFGSEPAATNGSVLEEKAFYRPLENLEKPTHP